MRFAAYSNSAPVAVIPLPSLTPAGAVDILVVAFLIYQALMIVKGTRAGHILIGILIMVAVYVIALYTGLEALRSLLSFIVPYLALAVIILFQSEIRRTLARLGRKRWFARGYQRPEFTEDILIAVGRLAADKTGALIVVERDIGLRTFIESGVRLDAHLSSDLLLSIFHPGGALHDGAVIVRKDKVTAANCFLPLTVNPALSSSFGTRHRAAIGITEETDCLSLVVSEETGRISLAAFGEFATGLTLRDVDERICTHFGVQRSAPHLIGEYAADIPMENNRPERTEPK
ncbi:MAG TPA: diadenylate cyclase CdaA [Bryobacteraceae bacterium]|nr:diadenylate cyclase CdaA [Bryobacteraceae bacterium]